MGGSLVLRLCSAGTYLKKVFFSKQAFPRAKQSLSPAGLQQAMGHIRLLTSRWSRPCIQNRSLSEPLLVARTQITWFTSKAKGPPLLESGFLQTKISLYLADLLCAYTGCPGEHR